MTRDIIVNGRFLSRRVTGVERYGREIFQRIRTHCRVEMTRANGAVGHAWEQFVLPSRIQSDAILWSPANTGPLWVRNQALTIHDLSPLEHPEWFKTIFALWYRFFLPILVRRVRIIFTPSEYVRRKVITRFGIKHVMVTANGVDMSVFHPSALQDQYDLPEYYILFLGSLEPRKNLHQLLQAWDLIKDECKQAALVIAGAHGNVFRSHQLSQTAERVHWLGYVAEEALPGLYANAKLFVLPSLEEGFGLPILEALACGAPVLASNRGALPETIGDAGFLFDPSIPGDLAASVRRCLSDDAYPLALREKGLARAQSYSWDCTAELIWNTLNEI